MNKIISKLYLLTIVAVLQTFNCAAQLPQIGTWYFTWYSKNFEAIWTRNFGVNAIDQFLADVDGDGFDDIVVVEANGMWNAKLSTADHPLNPYGQRHFTTIVSLYSNSFGLTANQRFITDIDNDGDLDLVAFTKSTGTWEVVLNTAGKGQPIPVDSKPQSWIINHGNETTNATAHLADINGDYLPDAVISYIDASKPNRLYVNCALNSGSGFFGAGAGGTFQAPTIWKWMDQNFTESTVDKVFIKDFSNGGKADICVYCKTTGNFYVQTNTILKNSFTITPTVSSGTIWVSGFAKKTSIGQGNNDVLASDVDGDGYCDIVNIEPRTTSYASTHAGIGIFGTIEKGAVWHKAINSHNKTFNTTPPPPAGYEPYFYEIANLRLNNQLDGYNHYDTLNQCFRRFDYGCGTECIPLLGKPHGKSNSISVLFYPFDGKWRIVNNWRLSSLENRWEAYENSIDEGDASKLRNANNSNYANCLNELPLNANGIAETYSSMDENVLNFHIESLVNAGFDFVIIDATNNILVDEETILQGAIKLVQSIKNYNAIHTKKLYYSFAIGGVNFGSGTGTTLDQNRNSIMKTELDIVNAFASGAGLNRAPFTSIPPGLNESFLINNATQKPLVVIYTWQQLWLDWQSKPAYTSYTDYKNILSFKHAQGANAQTDSWGWFNPTKIAGSDQNAWVGSTGNTNTMFVSPRKPYSIKNQRSGDAAGYSFIGQSIQFFKNDYLNSLSYRPDYVVVGCYNDYNEDNGFAPSNTEMCKLSDEKWFNPGTTTYNPYLFWNEAKQWNEALKLNWNFKSTSGGWVSDDTNKIQVSNSANGIIVEINDTTGYLKSAAGLYIDPASVLSIHLKVSTFTQLQNATVSLYWSEAGKPKSETMKATTSGSIDTNTTEFIIPLTASNWQNSINKDQIYININTLGKTIKVESVWFEPNPDYVRQPSTSIKNIPDNYFQDKIVCWFNKTNNQLNINSKTQIISQIQIYTIQGECIYNDKVTFEGKKTVQLHVLNPGIYLIQYLSSKKWHKKIAIF